jgi:hypothetical protein
MKDLRWDPIGDKSLVGEVVSQGRLLCDMRPSEGDGTRLSHTGTGAREWRLDLLGLSLALLGQLQVNLHIHVPEVGTRLDGHATHHSTAV